MKKIILAFIFVLPHIAFAQENIPLKIYEKSGKDVTYKNMLNKIKNVDVCFFGEIHNNPISHWYEYELTNSLFQNYGSDLVLGAEMLERDQQLILNEYLNGLIPVKKFEDGTNLWPNYETDYKPLVDFAAKNNLDFIATNIPRRYASLVHKKGFEGLKKLSSEAKKLIPPLPVPYDSNLKSYADMLSMGGMMKKPNPNFPKAQAIKDATMAYSISENIKENGMFLHFNGKYHSQFHEGIVWYLKKYAPEIKVITITTIVMDTVKQPDEDVLKEADFVIVVDDDITGSY